MDPDAQERFENIELKLSEHDEKIIAQDRSLSATRELLRAGVRLLVDQQTRIIEMDAKMAALVDSETRLYGALQELAEAQRRTEESLRRFLDRSNKGRSS